MQFKCDHRYNTVTATSPGKDLPQGKLYHTFTLVTGHFLCNSGNPKVRQYG